MVELFSLWTSQQTPGLHLEAQMERYCSGLHSPGVGLRWCLQMEPWNMAESSRSYGGALSMPRSLRLPQRRWATHQQRWLSGALLDQARRTCAPSQGRIFRQRPMIFSGVEVRRSRFSLRMTMGILLFGMQMVASSSRP